jgi:hypothetical protein
MIKYSITYNNKSYHLLCVLLYTRYYCKSCTHIILFISSRDPIKEVLHYLHFADATQKVWVTIMDHIIQQCSTTSSCLTAEPTVFNYFPMMVWCTLQMRLGPLEVSVLSYLIGPLFLASVWPWGIDFAAHLVNQPSLLHPELIL